MALHIFHIIFLKYQLIKPNFIKHFEYCNSTVYSTTIYHLSISQLPAIIMQNIFLLLFSIIFILQKRFTYKKQTATYISDCVYNLFFQKIRFFKTHFPTPPLSPPTAFLLYKNPKKNPPVQKSIHFQKASST